MKRASKPLVLSETMYDFEATLGAAQSKARELADACRGLRVRGSLNEMLMAQRALMRLAREASAAAVELDSEIGGAVQEWAKQRLDHVRGGK